ncbi:DNA-binding protein [Paenibacillus sp. HB172176]|uniref:DNA-binding protein n=1 Tax=Paenibacillus sp. HB172176 TaxID=2493690 RepID=UPI0014397AC3|nr:DNA-binding protein [Paenibacillus sp. HB172176]
MSDSKHISDVNELPKGLSKPAVRAVMGAGYTKLEHFTKVSEAELLELHGFGPKGIRTLRAALAEKGLSLRE